MKVYVAVYGWDYEGYNILGVFESEVKAQIAIDLNKQSTGYPPDYWEIYNHELNKSENDES